ncbi:hypothetical protein BX616_005866 [Lobosporangium transversale]|nr:hypothetical protein BX616_005866 [Lobosporangium transversale]
MSSPSAPPSTTTSSSLSRVDSISTMDYLQNNAQSNRHRSSIGASSTQSQPSTLQGQQPQQQQSQQQQQNDADPKNNNNSNNSNNGNGTSGTGTGAKENGAGKTEQGRNSSKRAAQNRAAQRAFRQRKDLYVRELERKAELLQAAETQLMTLAARNRELEAMVAAHQQQQQQTPSSSSPLPSPLPQQEGPGASLGRGEREWDREREWARERSFESGGPPYDHFHSSRPALGRHSSAQHLRQAYHASSPPLSNGSSKHLSLNSKLSSQFHHQRPESDQEMEIQGRPHRHLHRHPSESCLNLSRPGSFANPMDSKEEDYGHRTHSFRGSMDSRDMASPSSSNKSPLSISSAPYSSSGPHDSPAHHYPSSPLSPTHDRTSLYTSRDASRPTGHGGSGSMSSPTGSTGPADGPFGGNGTPSSSAMNYDLNKKRPSDGTVNWSSGSPSSELYRNVQAADPYSHPYHHAVKKQSSWSSLSEQRRLHAIKKQPSWGSISEHRQHWRTKTESPELSTAETRFGGSAPSLPRIPSQFSQRPPPPQQQQGFERDSYPPSSPAMGPTNNNNSQAPPPPPPLSSSASSSTGAFPYSPTIQHSRQPSDYYNNHARSHRDASHGPSDMEIVQEGGNGGTNGGYSRPGGYETNDPYDVEREERYNGRPEVTTGYATRMGSP